jgi:hypothetical protein
MRCHSHLTYYIHKLTTVASGNTSTNSACLGQGAVATTSESTFTHNPPNFTNYSAYTPEFDFLSSVSTQWWLADHTAHLRPHRTWTFRPCSRRHVSLRRAFAISCILIQSKAQTNGSSIPPQPGNGVGEQIISSHACETSASNVVRASSASTRDIVDHCLLQVSSSGLRLNIPDNSQLEQLSYALPWDGFTFASQTQGDDDTGTFAHVGMSGTMPCVYFVTR